MDNTVKVGFLVSYDYNYLFHSIPLVYKYADAIFLAIDKNHKTWSGDELFIPQDFFNWLETIDLEKKITLYQDDFYDSTLSSMQNDTRERNMLARFMGAGGWHIQIDADEYFINFENFVKFLKEDIEDYIDDILQPICVYVNVLTIYKELKEGYLIVESEEYLPIATRHPQYEFARVIKGDKLLINYKMIHQSWGRSEDDLKKKLKNWSHKDDFNIDSYFRLWQVCDNFNYKYYHDFHPLEPSTWSKLMYIKSRDIQGLVNEFDQDEFALNVKYYPILGDLERKSTSQANWLSKLNFFSKKH